MADSRRATVSPRWVQAVMQRLAAAMRHDGFVTGGRCGGRGRQPSPVFLVERGETPPPGKQAKANRASQVSSRHVWDSAPMTAGRGPR